MDHNTITWLFTVLYVALIVGVTAFVAGVVVGATQYTKRFREALRRSERLFDAIRSAVETRQVEDKDVRGTAKMGRDKCRRVLEGKEWDF